jgi:general secretion pathway protein N
LIHTKRGLLLIAALTAVFALILKFPARIAYHWAAPVQIDLSGIHGTVWRGRADALATNGIYLRNVRWRIKPLRLFTGTAMYRVEASPASGFVEGDVGVGIGGTLTASDLTASIPLQMFAKSLNIRGLQGSASLKFERIRVRDGLPVAATGTLQVDNLVAPQLSRDSIGGYRAEFFTQNDSISASVEDTDGVVDLAGSLQVDGDGSYTFLGQVVAKSQTPATLQRQMQYLGSANERGQRELRIEGSLR